MRAPRSTPVEKLDSIVHRRAQWILDRRLRQEDLPPPPSAREFVSGETFLSRLRKFLHERGLGERLETEIEVANARIRAYEERVRARE